MSFLKVSADCHMDLNWLPADLFTARAPAALRDRVPFVTDTPEGATWVTNRGKRFGLVKGIGPTGRKYVEGKLRRADIMEAESKIFSDGARGIPRVSDPEMRLKDMERDGVEAEVIYGILGVPSQMEDPEAALSVIRIYNDWMNEFRSNYPDRQLGLAVLPNYDVDAACDEVHRVAKMGYRGLDLMVSYDMDSMAHPKWEPLFEAVAEVGLPLHFHTAPHLPWNYRQHYPAAHGMAYQYQMSSVFQMTLGNTIAALIGVGVMERYPRMHFVFAECGTGWIPYLLERMDVLFEDAFLDLPLKMPPNEYWRRQCHAAFQYDLVGAALIDKMGVETLMWGSDYPHLDGVWPQSGDYIAEQFSGVSEEKVRRITGDNARSLYGLS